MQRFHNVVTRTMDLIFTTVAIILLSPVLLILAILVRIKLGAPVFFCQNRPCYKGELRKIYKFRTMTNACGEDGLLLPDSQRVTPFGLCLRRLSLDELPQLFNVIKGDLSLVGPRPLMPQYLTRYSPEQARRHDVMPGITGWAQVNGRTAIDWEERFNLDIWYVEHYSIWLNLKILGLTLFKVFKREGTVQPARPTNSEFLDTMKHKDPPEIGVQPK